MSDQQQIEQIKAEIQEQILEMVRYALVESTDEYALEIELNLNHKHISVTLCKGSKFRYVKRKIIKTINITSSSIYIQPFPSHIHDVEEWRAIKVTLSSVYTEMQKFIAKQKQVAS